ncbi:MAG: metal ABC transporter permease [Candidatus Thermoplasmatota archaeon]|nr:metal ABC transporter permease [Euryarchaeota archaeon]MBU4032293.1 metal ABC transporter permease [Candidatus Thermoplasmatota archaeon]MBU4071454.1 metal ABC transporter permease [Candidatus Thermoplasmatota archaeon]MBU4144442.1 metal ABC transporter permease [Candidatus Thermoplasmatota archaeon]MBU4592326.1 metal ABC transporter permease [Candidatus Thermoplasmatota archaeon]
MIDLLAIFGYKFFQNALLGGIISAAACAWVGLFLILRRESMMGDGVAHTAFGGIAIGLLLGISPLLTALVISVISVLGISYMKKKGLANSDAAIAVIMALGFATGLIIISLAGGFNVELFSYLFGSILTINTWDLVLVTALGLTTLTFLGIFYKELLSMTFDEDAARMTGIPVRAMSVVFNILVAMTIVVSIKVIGIVLVTALMIIPGLAALQLNLSFRKTVGAAITFGTISTFAGLVLSSFYDLATSGVIVFTAAAIFGFVALYRRLA